MANLVVRTPFPPQGQMATQLGQSAGTLTSVSIPVPVLTNESSVIPPFGGGPKVTGGFTGSAPLKAEIYDMLVLPGQRVDLGTPLISIDTKNGYAPIPLNLSYTKGLYVVSHTGSDIQLTTA